MHAVFNVRSEPTAEAWLAAIFDRNRFGMAMAAIIRMIATTIKSSIKEKPFFLFRMISPWAFEDRNGVTCLLNASPVPRWASRDDQWGTRIASALIRDAYQHY